MKNQEVPTFKGGYSKLKHNDESHLPAIHVVAQRLRVYEKRRADYGQ